MKTWLALLLLALSACTTFHHPTTGATMTCQWQGEMFPPESYVPWFIPVPTGHSVKEYRRCKERAAAGGWEAE